MIRPSFNAYLVNLINEVVTWSTEFKDEKRREWHEKKMNSKDERPSAQIMYSGIKSGHVIHLSTVT